MKKDEEPKEFCSNCGDSYAWSEKSQAYVCLQCGQIYETKCFCDICNQELDELKEISVYIDGKKVKEWQLCREHYNFVYDIVLGLFDAVNVKISGDNFQKAIKLFEKKGIIKPQPRAFDYEKISEVKKELKKCVICGKECLEVCHENPIKSLTCSDVCHEDLLKSLSVWLEIPLREYPVWGIYCLSGEPFQSIPKRGEDIRKRAEEKTMKPCAICGKKHNRRYTCSDKCHELFKQKLVKNLGEYKIVVDLTTGKEHCVPIVNIFEKGLKQEDLKNYPIVGINCLARRAIKKEKLKVSWIDLDTGEVEKKEMTFDEYKKEIGCEKMKTEQIEKLPSWKEQGEALKNAIARGDKPIECNCIPYKKWKLRKEVKITVSDVYPARPEDFHEYPVIMVFNEKLKTWQAEPLVEYRNVCPVCLKLMLVRAIAGSSWLACCSKECYEKYKQVKYKHR